VNWLEVSLVVNGELAEAVADVLARFAPNGVATEQAAAEDSMEPEGRIDGPITVRAYLPVDEQTDRKRKRITESLHYLGMIRPVPAPAFRLLAEQNWMEAWKQHYAPIDVGNRLVILPAWADAAASGRIPAFGTGTHPSTQLCLELIESEFDRRPAPGTGGSARLSGPFIDVGCGSGILCFAAIKLGAQSALGVDMDAEALLNARENAAANGLGGEVIFAPGSVANIRRGEFPWKAGSLVSANILAPVLISLLEDGLVEVVEHGGSLILGGILEQQTNSVLAAAEPRGLELLEKRQSGDWVALAMQRQLAGPPAGPSDPSR
jgi:ribosomal protein L11 methyltransferase